MSIVPTPNAGDLTLQRGFGRNYLDDLANKYIVKPKFLKGIGGFVFDYEGEESVRLKADITDHYVEDNSAVQDHVAKNPVRLSFRGYIGELVQKAPAGLVGALDTIQNKLTTLPAYLGKYTPGVAQTIQKSITKAQTTVNTIDQSLARIKNIVGFFDKSAPGKTNQEKAFRKLQSLWATNQIMVVETPYGTFGNMIIEEVVFIQPEDTKFWTDITVTMKGMRFVEVLSINLDKNAGRAAAQRSPTIQKGTTKGTPVTESLASKFVSLLHGN